MPDNTPVTTPVPLTTVATVVVPLDQVPPVTKSVKVMVKPEHTGTDPDIADGIELTVTTAVVKQPVPNA